MIILFFSCKNDKSLSEKFISPKCLYYEISGLKWQGKIMGNELLTGRKWVKIGILDRHSVCIAIRKNLVEGWAVEMVERLKSLVNKGFPWDYWYSNTPIALYEVLYPNQFIVGIWTGNGKVDFHNKTDWIEERW